METQGAAVGIWMSRRIPKVAHEKAVFPENEVLRAGQEAVVVKYVSGPLFHMVLKRECCPRLKEPEC